MLPITLEESSFHDQKTQSKRYYIKLGKNILFGSIKFKNYYGGFIRIFTGSDGIIILKYKR